MATRTKKSTAETTEQQVITPNTNQANQALANQNDKQSQLATILVGLLIIASGLLIYNYFQRSNSPETTSQSEQQQNQSKNDKSQDKDTAAETDTESQTKEGQYTVEAGDSLWSIAEKVYGNGFEWTKIRDANNLELNAYGQPAVEIGQVINVPDSAAVAQEPAFNDDQEQAVEDSNVAGIQEIRETPATAIQTYTVQHGDTLWSIAETVYGDGSKWDVIMNDPHNQIGQLPDGRPLVHSGNVLYIPEIL